MSLMGIIVGIIILMVIVIVGIVIYYFYYLKKPTTRNPPAPYREQRKTIPHDPEQNNDTSEIDQVIQQVIREKGGR